MWDVLKREVLSLILSQGDRLRVNMFMFIPSFSLEIRNIHLVFSTSIFDFFRFMGTKNVKNGYINFPFIKPEKVVKDLPDEGKSITFHYLTVDQMVRTSATDYVPFTKFAEEGNLTSYLELVSNAAKGLFPSAFLPPITVVSNESNNQRIYLVFPLIVYKLDYSPKSVTVQENPLFTPKFFNPESIAKGGIYALIGKEIAGEAFAPIFSSIQNKAVSPNKSTDVEFDISKACLLNPEERQELESAAETVSVLSKFMDESFIPNVELIYNLKFGKFWGGADFPKASIGVEASIVDFIAIDISYFEIMASYANYGYNPFGGFVTEDVVRTFIDIGAIKLLSEVVTDKSRYNRIARKSILRYVVMPKLILEYMKTQAARFFGVYKAQDTTMVHINVISGFDWGFNDYTFEGLPTSFSVKIDGSDLAYGIIREIPDLTTNWMHALIRTIKDSVEGLADVDLRSLEEIINSVWFDGVSADLNTTIASGILKLSDIVSPEVSI